MKKPFFEKFFFLLFLSASFLSNAQQYNYFEFDTNMPVQIDSTVQGNQWQIGLPQKMLFNTAYSEPNVLVTDTLEQYIPGQLSRCTVSIDSQTLGWAPWAWPRYIFMFAWKMDADPDFAGGFIEASYDGGMHWENIFSDTVYQIVFFGDGSIDTLWNGELGFTGTSDDWQMGLICWGALDYLPTVPPLPERIELRFSFDSDSMATPGDGWMLDNLEAWPEVIHTVKELESMMEAEEAHRIYPNPASDYINVVSKLGATGPYVSGLWVWMGNCLRKSNMKHGIKGFIWKAFF
ncbi:MAG: hypothetical protein R2792_07575 [Saprospiraceae bacterium]